VQPDLGWPAVCRHRFSSFGPALQGLATGVSLLGVANNVNTFFEVSYINDIKVSYLTL
jgi:hypothetical protein